MTNNEYLSTQIFIHKRDENENILPVDVDIPELKGKVKILPMTKGEIAKLQTEMTTDITSIEQDKKLIEKHVLMPKFKEADFKFFKPIEYSHLVTAVMIASGIPKDKIKEASKNLMEKTNPQSK